MNSSVDQPEEGTMSLKIKRFPDQEQIDLDSNADVLEGSGKFRYVLAVELLTEEPIKDNEHLEDIVNDGTVGESSLRWWVERVDELTDESMRGYLVLQGSDPDFFDAVEDTDATPIPYEIDEVDPVGWDPGDTEFIEHDGEQGFGDK